MTTKTWDGNAMSQEDMMIKDTVLVLDDNDNVIGSASKRTSHEFNADQPRGILHRAFSVFLFDESTGELLLQQRASTKITFPNVRTWESSPRTQSYRTRLQRMSHIVKCFFPFRFFVGDRCGRTHVVPIRYMGWIRRRWIRQRTWRQAG